jgi:small-conductance mechanosensitive channel
MKLQSFLEYRFFEVGHYHLTVYKLVLLLLIFFGVKLALLFVKKALRQRWRFKKLDAGGEFAVFQIIRYMLWIVAIVWALETLGFKITILIAGSAALLVGVGLGLQQTFNDIISGIILLIEGSTKVGDVLEIDNTVVQVREVGLRTSKAVDRDDIVIIIPNSIIVTNKVVNWSHRVDETRFHIKVGVAYGSNVDLVIELLEQSVIEHANGNQKRPPEARFIDFGESSLDFDVLFWSDQLFRIEKIKSDIRRIIDRKFRENNVVIPFPQRDLHIKSSTIQLK